MKTVTETEQQINRYLASISHRLHNVFLNRKSEYGLEYVAALKQDDPELEREIHEAISQISGYYPDRDYQPEQNQIAATIVLVSPPILDFLLTTDGEPSPSDLILIEQHVRQRLMRFAEKLDRVLLTDRTPRRLHYLARLKEKDLYQQLTISGFLYALEDVLTDALDESISIYVSFTSQKVIDMYMEAGGVLDVII